MMTRYDPVKTIERLAELRQTNERSSEEVVDLGSHIIKDKATSKLGDQIWPFYEQVTVAALDTQNFELAQYCTEQLKERFGEDSLRFKRLLGMKLEAEGKLDEAQEVYSSILQQDDTNMLASKRQIALLKARNKEHDMVEALTTYLDTYYDDYEAWLELCDVYVSKYMYDQAAYCCEELIILQPSNHIIYLKYAELLYTLNNYAMALKYYCKVLELCTDHVRALYGLQLTASKLLGSNEVDHASELHALSIERLLEVYKKGSESTKKIVQSYIEA
ncbi:hypothetical protein BDB01DRAFT_194686 [Pilobolus umbonatus]|nr:hypothetical protein BDB01DRAFT_194686 [Pilobolus umbonatus]